MMEIIMTNLEAEKDSASSAAKAQPSSGLISEKIFQMMKVYLGRGEGKHLPKKVNAVFGFNINKKKGDMTPTLVYEIDLKNG
jgi:hypothetical protein